LKRQRCGRRIETIEKDDENFHKQHRSPLSSVHQMREQLPEAFQSGVSRSREHPPTAANGAVRTGDTGVCNAGCKRKEKKTVAEKAPKVRFE